MQNAQYQRQSRSSGCDRKSRQSHPRNHGARGVRSRVASGVRRRQIDNQTNRRDRLKCNSPNAETVDFNQSGQRLRRAHQQPSRVAFHMDAVIRDQPREGESALCGSCHKVPNQS